MDAPRPTSDERLRRIEASARSPHQRAHADIGVDDVLWLVARVTDLEAKLAKGWDEVVANDKARAIRAEIALEAAEAQVAALTQERDEHKQDATVNYNAMVDEQVRAEAAEAALATTRQALAQIAHPIGPMLTTPMSQDIARRALAATEPK